MLRKPEHINFGQVKIYADERKNLHAETKSASNKFTPMYQYTLKTWASNRLKYHYGLGSSSAKFIFSDLPPVRVFRRFDFAGSVPVKIINTLNYLVQVRRSTNLKVQAKGYYRYVSILV